MIPVICIVAAVSNMGKTTFMEKIIAEMVERGYRVGAVKSDSHGFEVDVPGKDSWRFRQAGANVTAIVGNSQYAVIQKTDKKAELDEIVSVMRDVDLILVEGFKQARMPKIEVVRSELSSQIVSDPKELIAIITDLKEETFPAPAFAFHDFSGVADLIVQKFL
ncbi:MAG: molybdopterin-guanine dinucleotide biosynthesis protein B [Sporomusaceae bacterium]|nr:molybdopterin-guanine dinucleotide biosynthesis protein B [Sporomusaceae bacterium]